MNGIIAEFGFIFWLMLMLGITVTSCTVSESNTRDVPDPPVPKDLCTDAKVSQFLTQCDPHGDDLCERAIFGRHWFKTALGNSLPFCWATFKSDSRRLEVPCALVEDCTRRERNEE
jgi:hypothetical protein